MPMYRTLCQRHAEEEHSDSYRFVKNGCPHPQCDASRASMQSSPTMTFHGGVPSSVLTRRQIAMLAVRRMQSERGKDQHQRPLR